MPAVQGCSCDRNLLAQAAQRGVANNGIRISAHPALLSFQLYLNSWRVQEFGQLQSGCSLVDLDLTTVTNFQ